VRIRYVDAGPRDGGTRPFLFVHGWSCDHSHFAPQARHFGGNHRVVSIDQRGFGASDAPEQDYSVDGYVSDVAFVCEQLGLDRPLLVGHSLGGAVVLATAARFPELASGIVMCDPAIFPPALAVPFLEELTAKLAGDDYREVAQEFVESAMFLDSDDPAIKQEIQQGMLRTAQHVMISALTQLAHFDGYATARQVTTPVLFIGADAPITELDAFREACPHAEIASTPGFGHFHQLLAPETINAQIEAFAARIARR
jgi:pimeloyl-ACP methyl ester carboxylesterase